MAIQRWGASPEDWTVLSAVAGLQKDLLPVVSNPSAVISKDSTLQELGKTPSLYSRDGVVGMAKWTQRVTTYGEIVAWERQPDYGICIQTRELRAIDVDIDDRGASGAVMACIDQALGFRLPRRLRLNSGKFLLAFLMPGEFPKRRVKTATGLIEFLGNGQQFVAVGTHPSGVRYEWEDGLPSAFPALTPEQFEPLWALLAQRFGVGDDASSIGRVTTRHAVRSAAIERDPVAQFLIANDWALNVQPEQIDIRCPWEFEHTAGNAISGTSYFPANTHGYAQGHFACLHTHCASRSDHEFRNAIGYTADGFSDLGVAPAVTPAATPAAATATADGFANLDSGTPTTTPAAAPSTRPAAGRFAPVRYAELVKRPALDWIIDGVLPDARLGMLFGASGSGKSFVAIDLALHVAAGAAWQGARTEQRTVVYLAAEGEVGARARIQAAAAHLGIDLATAPFLGIEDAPNLLMVDDVRQLIVDLQPVRPGLIIIDTLAQTLPGANENSAEDMGKAINHCRAIHKHTGALVLLVHHAGKDVERGARGWSGIKAAADFELEVTRIADTELRCLKVSKLKDGRDGQRWDFKLLDADAVVGEDERDVQTCVVAYQEHGDGGGVRKVQKAPRGVNQTLVWQVAHELGGFAGMVPEEDLINEAVSRKSFTQSATGKKRDQRRPNLERALDELANVCLLWLREGVVYLQDPASPGMSQCLESVSTETS